MANESPFIQVITTLAHVRAQQEIMPPAPEKNRNELAIAVATAYLLACERAGMHHHPEDHPLECFDLTTGGESPMQNAWEAMWAVIGEQTTKNPHYVTAWAVWGVLLPECMGTGNAESTL